MIARLVLIVFLAWALFASVITLVVQLVWTLWQ
jgi:hypothetical protein